MNLEVKEIPIPKDAKHPPPPDPRLPKHEFSMALVAPKGSGKTTVLANLLNFYKGYFHTIIVFSPTVASDEKWDCNPTLFNLGVKQQKLLVENKPLKKWILDQSRARKEDQIVQSAPIGHELEGLVNMRDQHDGLIPEKYFISEYDQDTLVEIMSEQMKICTLLKKHGKTKHLVRNNYSCLVLFETPNAKEIECIYEEFPVSLDKDSWMEMYQHATQEEHDFLFINNQQKKQLRCMRNFQEVLFFQ